MCYAYNCGHGETIKRMLKRPNFSPAAGMKSSFDNNSRPIDTQIRRRCVCRAQCVSAKARIQNNRNEFWLTYVMRVFPIPHLLYIISIIIVRQSLTATLHQCAYVLVAILNFL